MAEAISQAIDDTKRQSIFTYNILRGPEYIRILTLDPRAGENELSCTLETVELHRAEDDYIALSYVWGNPAKTSPIICNGKLMQVTVNLAEALRGLRDPTTPTRLWADAICIDQSNNAEKKQQVRMMGMIYTNARRIIVWLGTDPEGIASDCFALISRTNSYLDQQLAIHGSWADIPTLVKPYPDAICDNKLRWDKVRKMISLPWFTRVWVIQEAGLAKRCSLQWGKSDLEFAHIMELASWQLHREDVSEITGPLGLIRIINQFRDVYCTFNNPVTWRVNLPLIGTDKAYAGRLFVDLLYAANNGTGATDKRDHIFAFLGSPLALQENGKLLVEPDYNKDWRDVYYEAACSFLRHPREAAFVLSRVKHFSPASLKDPTIPTWIPRWDRTPEFTISRPYFWFRAGGTGDFSPLIREDRTLAVQGIIIGSVAFTSRPIRKHNVGMDPRTWDEEYRVTRKPFIDVLWEETLQAVGQTVAIDQDQDQFEKEFTWTLAREFPAADKTCDSRYMAEFETYRRLVRSAAISNNYSRESHVEPPPSHIIEVYPRNFTGRFYNYCHDLRVAVLDSGRLGLVPEIAEPGDYCCVLLGVPVPIILRLVSSKDKTYNLVGESYVRGVMAGEAIESGESETKHQLENCGTIIIM